MTKRLRATQTSRPKSAAFQSILFAFETAMRAKKVMLKKDLRCAKTTFTWLVKPTGA